MRKSACLLLLLLPLLLSCEKEYLSYNCPVPAIVRDLSGLDGCGFVFELVDGTVLIPLRTSIIICATPPLPESVTNDPLWDFEFVDGKRVNINYIELADYASACMRGKTGMITCIS